MDEFTIAPFTWFCGCGYKPKMFTNGISSDGFLTASFHCPRCNAARIARFSIVEIVKYTPAGPAPQILLPAATWTAKDQSLLAEMHIKLGED